MHEATVKILKLWPPFKPGDKRTNLEDTEGNKYRIDIINAAGLHDGDTVDIGVTDEKTSAEFGAKPFKLIKKIKLVGPSRVAPAPAPADVGPHVAMWEKIISDLLVVHGMAEAAVPVHIITCRRIAREGLKADIDGRLLPQGLSQDPNDELDNTF